MTIQHTKTEITKIVLNHIPESSIWHTLSVDKVIFRWWSAGRSGTSFRLSDEGFEAFNIANIEYYEYPLGYEITPDFNPEVFNREINKINCPFYLGVHKQINSARTLKNALKSTPYIRLYDDKVAMVVSLYGNLKEYLESFNNRL